MTDAYEDHYGSLWRASLQSAPATVPSTSRVLQLMQDGRERTDADIALALSIPDEVAGAEATRLYRAGLLTRDRLREGKFNINIWSWLAP